MEPWNQITIMQPPMNTAICEDKIDFKELEHVLNNIVMILSKQAPLHKESALLSRFLYKFDKKFRNDIGYRKFKKVNTALRKYLTLDLLKDVTNFITVLPDNYYIDSYLPTRQMLEYILVRIMSFAKLMSRIIVCSKQSAIFYLNRIKRGESHWMSLMPYALLSRIWSMSFVLIQHSCNWYNRLHIFSKSLVHKGLAFLPEDYELPNDLTVWIDIKSLNDEGRFNWSQKSTLDTHALLTENEEGDLCENILMYADKINSPEDETEPNETSISNRMNTEHLEIPIVKDDLGVAISRESFKPLSNNKLQTINKTKEKEHSISNVVNLQTLQEFILKEDGYRNESSKLSVTGHLSFMQWQSLKITLQRFENSIIRDRKLQMKVQKIWKEKCLEYLYI